MTVGPMARPVRMAYLPCQPKGLRESQEYPDEMDSLARRVQRENPGGMGHPDLRVSQAEGRLVARREKEGFQGPLGHQVLTVFRVLEDPLGLQD